MFDRTLRDGLMLRADDFHLGVGDVHFRPAFLIFFLLCSVVGWSAVVEEDCRRPRPPHGPDPSSC